MSYAPGIYDDVSNTDYHADPALGSTSLKTLATRTPAHWQYEREHPVHKDVYDIGTLAHSLILEGDESAVEVIDVPDKRGKKWTDPADDARAGGKIPVTTAEWSGIVAMRDAVMRHDVARQAFTGHRPEVSVFWEEETGMYKCRPDALHQDLIVDLKTTINADPREFGRTAHGLGYHQSAAHYIDGMKAATGDTLPFVFVLVEKTAPYLVSVVELDEEALDYGRRLNERAKRIYAACAEANLWPGYESSGAISLPKYATYQTEELLENE